MGSCHSSCPAMVPAAAGEHANPLPKISVSFISNVSMDTMYEYNILFKGNNLLLNWKRFTHVKLVSHQQKFCLLSKHIESWLCFKYCLALYQFLVSETHDQRFQMSNKPAVTTKILQYTSDIFLGLVSTLQNRFDKRAINSAVDLLTKAI